MTCSSSLIMLRPRFFLPACNNYHDEVIGIYDRDKYEELILKMTVQRRMVRIILFILFCIVAPSTYARGGYGYLCSNLAEQLRSPTSASDTTPSVLITERTNLRIYDAPNLYCKERKVHVNQGEVLAVYQSNNEWVNVGYIDKNGMSYMGWILASKARAITKTTPTQIHQ